MQQSTVILVPGLGDSGPEHWQSLWQQQYPSFERVRQLNWDTPEQEEWVEELNKVVQRHNPEQVVLVAHSLACIAVAFWAQKYNQHIKGALLVAPADTETPTFPEDVIGFAPIPMQRLPFRSVLVSSSNDEYISASRARQLATAWGSRYVNIGMTGHINSASGHGRWEEGLELLRGLCGTSRL
ncbi:RBBP9/YdeN family alpha/beta hydrolase [Pontibacter anaerobius]|uniref:Alpha/beta hydrolase n=1 Tax=Pontibacter anaerobius TaxID=2993940 RepID=A0ABT3RKE2_9BACT|nr:alpha/beta hydrolase [Pontibacter anaerobius]MCX2741670.1 alpha/beta hydrolase [Pontibacter anaerobius]